MFSLPCLFPRPVCGQRQMNFKSFVRFGDEPQLSSEALRPLRHSRKSEALFQLVNIHARTVIRKQKIDFPIHFLQFKPKGRSSAVTETVRDPLFQSIAQKSVLRVRNGYVVYIRTNFDSRSVRRFVDDSLQRVFESLLSRISRKQVHALAEFFQGVFRLKISGDNLAF